MTHHPRFRPLAGVLALAGLFLLALWARTEFAAHAYQQAESARIDAAIARRVSGPDAFVARTTASGPPADRGHVLGRLEIPRLRITAVVAEGVDAKTLGRAIGHVTTTALPGRPGNCGLAGHRDTFLRGLGNVRAKDTIRIVTAEHTYLYRVEWTRVVEPRSIDVLAPTPERSLTLVTCYPFRFIGRAPNRFIVRARQVDDQPVVAGGGS